MQRRRLLQLGAGATMLLGLAGAGAAWWRAGWAEGRLTADGRSIFAAISRGVLGPLLPADDTSALAGQLNRLDAAIAGLPPGLQRELGQLLSVLATPPLRMALTGLASDWAEADAPTLSAMLDRLRHSSSTLRQQTYHALRGLVNAAWFADAAHWSAIGYPGPKAVNG